MSGGRTCDRCAATQHEVEHALHTLEEALRPRNHNFRSANSTRSRSSRARLPRTAFGSPVSRSKSGSKAPSEAAAAAHCAATRSAAPSRSGAPPSTPYQSDATAGVAARHLKAPRHATGLERLCVRLETGSENVRSNVQSDPEPLPFQQSDISRCRRGLETHRSCSCLRWLGLRCHGFFRSRAIALTPTKPPLSLVRGSL